MRTRITETLSGWWDVASPDYDVASFPSATLAQEYVHSNEKRLANLLPEGTARETVVAWQPRTRAGLAAVRALTQRG